MVSPLPIDDHRARLAEAYTRRLEELEVKAAKLGYETPPQVANEIEDIRRQLANLVDNVVPLTPEDRYQSSMRAIMLLSQQLASLETKVERLYWALPTILFLYLIVSFVLDHL